MNKLKRLDIRMFAISLILSVVVVTIVGTFSHHALKKNIAERKTLIQEIYGLNKVAECEIKKPSQSKPKNECSAKRGEPKVAIDALKDNHKAYLNNVWSTMGFLMLAIGWVVTSDKARAYWRNSSIIRNISLCTVVIIMVFHFTILKDISAESQRILELMKPPSFGSSYYLINERMVEGSMLVNGCFFVLLWFLIALQFPKAENDNSKPDEKENTSTGSE